MNTFTNEELTIITLTSLSPIDGRYESYTRELRNTLSEYGYFKFRLQVEVTYLCALLQKIPTYTSLVEDDVGKINSIVTEFDVKKCLEIKEIERTINHDVKSIEYYIGNKLNDMGLSKYKSFVHFGLTSQDINNTAIPLMIRTAIEGSYLDALNLILKQLETKVDEWGNVVMISKTHGQPAVPTTFGKEMKVFSYRINKEKTVLANIKYYAKFGGATGNMNAHLSAFPTINWTTFVSKFLDQLDLVQNEYTTQIDNYENLSRIFDSIKRINCILIDLCQDIWLYISYEYLKLSINKNEVGSSTMPHKVNPINFENAEGNLLYANSSLEFLSRKLPVSRLQRDLTDSTLVRNIGAIFGHILIGYKNITKGLSKINVNKEIIDRECSRHIVVVIEGIQTILRKYKYTDAYEKCKEFSRVNSNINALDLECFVNDLEVEENVKNELYDILSTDKYVGYSIMNKENEHKLH